MHLDLHTKRFFDRVIFSFTWASHQGFNWRTMAGIHVMAAPGVNSRNQPGPLSHRHNRDGGHLGGVGFNGQQPI